MRWRNRPPTCPHRRKRPHSATHGRDLGSGDAIFSRPDARRLVLLGTGQVARLLPQAYSTVLPIDHIQVWNINRGSAERLAAEFSSADIAASVADDPELAVAGADIISAATLSTSPLIQGKWLKPGQHVDLIGSFTPGMREADDEAIRKSFVFVDNRTALVSVRGKVASNQSVMIHRGDLILLGIAKCGRTKIVPAMIAASCAIPAI
ncbi:MAG: hypothetical protein ACR652_23965 [Methylocystis sp.]|uniref:hypothetical protein n=1 Tax=Methylocystis sp. TaxID=1911079 RepID=UPI003DA2B189